MKLDKVRFLVKSCHELGLLGTYLANALFTGQLWNDRARRVSESTTDCIEPTSHKVRARNESDMRACGGSPASTFS